MKISFRVTGRVQGVGFRWFAKETAEALAVTGWVRNVSDGSVEGEAQGTLEAVESFLSALRSPCLPAVTEKLETQEMLGREDAGEKFRIEPTV